MKYVNKPQEVEAIKYDGTNLEEVKTFLHTNNVLFTTRLDGLVWVAGSEAPCYINKTYEWVVLLAPCVAVTMTDEQFQAKYMSANKERILELPGFTVDLSRIMYIEYNKTRSHAWAVMDDSTWNTEMDGWNNAPYLVGEEMDLLETAWKNFNK